MHALKLPITHSHPLYPPSIFTLPAEIPTDIEEKVSKEIKTPPNDDDDDDDSDIPDMEEFDAENIVEEEDPVCSLLISLVDQLLYNLQ